MWVLGQLARGQVGRAESAVGSVGTIRALHLARTWGKGMGELRRIGERLSSVSYFFVKSDRTSRFESTIDEPVDYRFQKSRF